MADNEVVLAAEEDDGDVWVDIADDDELTEEVGSGR